MSQLATPDIETQLREKYRAHREAELRAKYRQHAMEHAPDISDTYPERGDGDAPPQQATREQGPGAADIEAGLKNLSYGTTRPRPSLHDLVASGARPGELASDVDARTAPALRGMREAPPPAAGFGAGAARAYIETMPKGLLTESQSRQREAIEGGYGTRQPEGAGAFVGGIAGSFPAGFIPTDDPAHNAMVGLNAVPAGAILRQVAPRLEEAITKRIAAVAGERAAAAFVHATEIGGTAALDAGAKQASQENWQADPLGAAQRTIGAAFQGGATGALIGGVMGAATHGSSAEVPRETPEQTRVETENRPTMPQERPAPETTPDTGAVAKAPETKPEANSELAAGGENAQVAPFEAKAYRGGAAEGQVGGTFYSPDRKVAESYANGGPVHETTVQFEKPLVAENWMEAKKALGLDPSADMPALLDAARSAGHDGVVFRSHNGSPEYVALPKESPDAQETPIRQAEEVPGGAVNPPRQEARGGAGGGEAVPEPREEGGVPQGDRQRITSARKSMTEADREAMGLDTLDSPVRRSWEKALDDARAEGIPERASRIAAEVNAKPRSLSDTETAGLVDRATALKNEHAALHEQIGKATDSAEIATKAAEARRIEEEFDTLTAALRKSGTEKGRALASQKLTLDQDFSLVAVKNRAKAAKGKALSEAESARLSSLTKELESTTKRVAELEQQMREQTAERAVRRHASHRKMAPEAREAEFGALLGRTRELLKKGCR